MQAMLIDHWRPPDAGRWIRPVGISGTAADRTVQTRQRQAVGLFEVLTGWTYPFEDCWPYVRVMADAFTLDHCMWASDWPYLRAPQRQDYGPLVELVEFLFPNPTDRRALLWETPKRLFGFGE